MDELAELHLGPSQTIKFQGCRRVTGKIQVTFDLVPLVEEARDYAAEDADITLRLFNILKPRLVTEHMATVYETLERPLVPVLRTMEAAGIKADRGAAQATCPTISRCASGSWRPRVHKLAGREFNVGSPKQLGEILFDEMGLPGGKKGKTGAYSTGADGAGRAWRRRATTCRSGYWTGASWRSSKAPTPTRC